MKDGSTSWASMDLGRLVGKQELALFALGTVETAAAASTAIGDVCNKTTTDGLNRGGNTLAIDEVVHTENVHRCDKMQLARKFLLVVVARAGRTKLSYETQLFASSTQLIQLLRFAVQLGIQQVHVDDRKIRELGEACSRAFRYRVASEVPTEHNASGNQCTVVSMASIAVPLTQKVAESRTLLGVEGPLARIALGRQLNLRRREQVVQADAQVRKCAH